MLFLVALLATSPSSASDSASRQAEAKIRLLKFFQAEKAEFQREGKYTAAVSHFEDKDRGANGPQRYYTLGVPDACAGGAGENISLFGPTELRAVEKVAVREYFRNVPASECSPKGFRVFAVGIISEAGADVWAIDQDKEMLNVRWGLPPTTGIFARVWRVLSALWGSP
jgi:hypothetical protein